jgi:hypothetical protein
MVNFRKSVRQNGDIKRSPGTRGQRVISLENVSVAELCVSFPNRDACPFIPSASELTELAG